MAEQQLPLFREPHQEPGPPKREPRQITALSSLHDAIGAFGEHMRRVDFSQNTINSFRWDLDLLERYLGPQVEIGAIGSRDLRTFMEYIRQRGPGARCSAKSYSRRLTTLKVFFGWLAGAQVLTHDPAAPLAHEPASSPLPQILFDEQVQRALEAAHALAGDARNPDPRPLLLFSLLLQTGMKKSECLALQIGHFDFSDPAAPAVYVRYKDPRRRHKERKLALDRSFPGLFRRYLEAHHPRLALFPCTGRNLEYVLHRLAQVAGLDEGLSFEMLRWTCAVRDFRAGRDPDTLRRKLGLSEIAWQETLPKIQALAAPPL